MKKIIFCALSLLFLFSSHASDFTLNPDHSQIKFSVSYMTISSVEGAFAQFAGKAVFTNDSIPTNFELTINSKSVTTFEKKRDHHLKKDDFFWVNRHPEILFRSQEILPTADKEFLIKGELVFQGRSYSQEFQAKFLGETTDPWGKKSLFYEFQGLVNRKELGLTWNQTLDSGQWLVGEEVKVFGKLQFQERGNETAFSTHMVAGTRAGQKPEVALSREEQADRREGIINEATEGEEEIHLDAQEEVITTSHETWWNTYNLSLILLSFFSLIGIVLGGILVHQKCDQKWLVHLCDLALIICVFFYALAVQEVFS